MPLGNCGAPEGSETAFFLFRHRLTLCPTLWNVEHNHNVWFLDSVQVWQSTEPVLTWCLLMFIDCVSFQCLRSSWLKLDWAVSTHWKNLKDIMWRSPSLNPIRSLANPKSGKPCAKPCAKPFAKPFAYLLVVLQTCFFASLLRFWVALQMCFVHSHHWSSCLQALNVCRPGLKLFGISAGFDEGQPRLPLDWPGCQGDLGVWQKLSLSVSQSHAVLRNLQAHRALKPRTKRRSPNGKVISNLTRSIWRKRQDATKVKFNMLQHVGDVQQGLECTAPGHEEVQSIKAFFGF